MQQSEQAIILRDIFDIVAHPDRLAWERFREGIDIYPLYKSDKGCSAALLRYAPGASVPRHNHVGYEHILVLSGAQHDERHHYPEGTLTISPPGTSHAVQSPEGCIVLAIWEKPVSFV